MSPWPGGFHSSDGWSGQLTGACDSASSLGIMLCMKSGARPSLESSGCLASAASVSSRVASLSISSSGSRTPNRRRSASVWPMMMSRNVRPSRASSSDFGLRRPIVVARPPLSLITANCSSAPAGSPSGSSSSEGTSVAGSSSSVGIIPESPPSRRS